VVGDQVTDDVAQRELIAGGVDQRGGDVVAKPQVAALGLGLALPLGLSPLLVLGGRVAYRRNARSAKSKPAPPTTRRSTGVTTT
jgi:hypothetical protein